MLRREIAHRAAAGERKHPLQLLAQDRQRPGNARFAAGGEAIQGGTTEQHTIGAQREGLGDIRATAKAAVNQHLHAVTHRCDDFGQGFNRRRRAIQAAATVVGHHHALGAKLPCQQRVLGGEHALDQQRTAPLRPHPGDVIPAQFWITLRARELG